MAITKEEQVTRYVNLKKTLAKLERDLQQLDRYIIHTHKDQERYFLEFEISLSHLEPAQRLSILNQLKQMVEDTYEAMSAELEEMLS